MDFFDNDPAEPESPETRAMILDGLKQLAEELGRPHKAAAEALREAGRARMREQQREWMKREWRPLCERLRLPICNLDVCPRKSCPKYEAPEQSPGA